MLLVRFFLVPNLLVTVPFRLPFGLPETSPCSETSAEDDDLRECRPNVGNGIRLCGDDVGVEVVEDTSADFCVLPFVAGVGGNGTSAGVGGGNGTAAATS